MSILGRRVSGRISAAVAAGLVSLGGLFPAWSNNRPREIVLVAKDMAFYESSDPSAANPVLTAMAGETVRVVLKNADRGMTHDFAVPFIGAAIEPLQWDHQDAVTFQVPRTPGSYEYFCRPHLLMMKGTLRVTK